MPLNEKSHFEEIKDKIKNYVAMSEFKRDLKSNELAYIMDIIQSEHDFNEQLHKYEMTINKIIFFRAKINSIHILYAFYNNIIFFLRAFKNFNEYTKMLSNPKQLIIKVKEENNRIKQKF